MENTAIAYLLLRLTIAASMLSHGLVRLPKLSGFSQWMASSFENSMLPAPLVVPFSYALVFVEFGTGLLLVAGLWTKQASIVGGAAMVALLFGTGLIEKWDYMPSQMIHSLCFVLLLVFQQYNTYSVDALWRTK